ncbi:site-2 protease family protein [Oxynema sp. CENA135]|uniref:site-2 protease family protein n=1 Tax=Oxynema sp. CENA135 TaxID=984206 RepID=UPI00190A796B|nr:site-2 protease family protein [Oxynema sp. CENA135]MBK4732239.1 site-2 protease family protein [Oxynema sp. CENA135]
MNNNIRVGNLFGIPFYINPSWFLVLGLVTLSYGGLLASQFSMGGILPWILGFVSALLLFASVLAHELGHSFVALKQGIDVKSITLFLFGGLASLEKESDSPAQAFWVAIAGPLVSLALFATFSAIGIATGASGPLGAMLALLASINLVVALFNLIPGLPLDGGNILKAIVWKITGNPYKGINFAGRVGQVIGWIAILSGAIPLLFYGNFNSIWNILIGWFLLQNAGFAAQSATVQDRLSALTAADVVDRENSPIVSADLSLRQFANNYVIGKEKWRKFLVTDESDRLIGTLNVDDLKLVSTADWPKTQVRELVKPMEDTLTVTSDRSLLEVVSLLEEKQINELPVVGENGALVGLLEKAEIIRKLQQRTETKADRSQFQLPA